MVLITLAAIGVFCGAHALILVIIASSTVGTVISIVSLVLHSKSRPNQRYIKQYSAFGTYGALQKSGSKESMIYNNINRLLHHYRYRPQEAKIADAVFGQGPTAKVRRVLQNGLFLGDQKNSSRNRLVCILHRYGDGNVKLYCKSTRSLLAWETILSNAQIVLEKYDYQIGKKGPKHTMESNGKDGDKPSVYFIKTDDIH